MRDYPVLFQVFHFPLLLPSLLIRRVFMTSHRQLSSASKKNPQNSSDLKERFDLVICTLSMPFSLIQLFHFLAHTFSIAFYYVYTSLFFLFDILFLLIDLLSSNFPAVFLQPLSTYNFNQFWNASMSILNMMILALLIHQFRHVRFVL